MFSYARIRVSSENPRVGSSILSLATINSFVFIDQITRVASRMNGIGLCAVTKT